MKKWISNMNKLWERTPKVLDFAISKGKILHLVLISIKLNSSLRRSRCRCIWRGKPSWFLNHQDNGDVRKNFWVKFGNFKLTKVDLVKLESIHMHVFIFKAKVGSYKNKTISLNDVVSIKTKKKSNSLCVEINMRASMKVTGKL